MFTYEKTVLFLGLTSVAAGLLTGCVERRVVYVRQPVPEAEVAPETPPPGEVPPPPQTEVITVAPGPEYVWVPGVWGWHGRWVWGGGHWVIGPHPHAIWFPGHWERHGRRSVYIRGYWR